MKKIRKKILTLVVMTLIAAISLSTASTQAFSSSQVYAAANYESEQLEQYALQVAIIVNRERISNGLSPLKFSNRLSEVANLRAKETETLFSHKRPNGTSCFTALDEAGIDYYYAGENIAYGQKTPELVMKAWMNSSGHRANILSESPEYLGVGVTYNKEQSRYYWVQIFTYSSGLDGQVPVDPESLPKITQQPKNFVGKIGDTVSFKVKASGQGLTYQWQLSDDGNNWRNSSVKTANYYTTLTAANNGRYVRCVIKDKYGTAATSDTVQMRTSAVQIVSQPVDCFAKVGSQVKFTVRAVGDSLSYQWQLSDDNGKTWRNSSVKSANYYTTLTDKNVGRYVRCVVTDKYGNKATSLSASMESPYVRITDNPIDCVSSIGGSVSFSVSATGEGLTYQWQLSDDNGKNWRNSSTKSSTYKTILTSVNNGRWVRCSVKDKYGNTAVSGSAQMRTSAAQTAMQIISQPSDCVTNAGGQVKFTVKAVGDGLSYQWQLSDDNGKTWRNSSVKSANYYTTLTYVNSGRYVRCIVTDKYGSKVTSKSAQIKPASLEIVSQPADVKVNIGSQVKFTVQAVGDGLSYQWQLSDDDGKTWRNSSVKSANYYTTLTNVNNGRCARCIVTDNKGHKVTSNKAYMTAR